MHCRFSFIACLAAILKSEAVLAVFSVNFNSLEETFHDEMLSKSQQVFASAHKDIQRLTWNFHSENSTKKMLLRTKQAAHLLTESWTKVEKILRAPDQKYRESHDRSEISYFILFHQKYLFGKLFSKIIIKSSCAFWFFQKLQ